MALPRSSPSGACASPAATSNAPPPPTSWQSRGIAVFIGHDPAHLDGFDAVVVTAAVKGANAEIDAARARGIAVIRRKEMLGALVEEKRTVGVVGHARQDHHHGHDRLGPRGSRPRSDHPRRRHAAQPRLERQDAAAASFWWSRPTSTTAPSTQLHPEIAVVTNIEADHLEYYGRLRRHRRGLPRLRRRAEAGRAMIGCVDDPAVAALLAELITRVSATGSARRRRSHGAQPHLPRPRLLLRSAKASASSSCSCRASTTCATRWPRSPWRASSASSAGRSPPALAKFLGVDRRFQILGDYSGALVVDDYAHHPTEIRATLDAARSGYPSGASSRSFSRISTRARATSRREFGESLRRADVALVAPIYAAREKPIEGISARMIADAGEGIEFLDRSHDEIIDELRARLQPNDVFIAMGAGDVHEIAEALVRGGGGLMSAVRHHRALLPSGRRRRAAPQPAADSDPALHPLRQPAVVAGAIVAGALWSMGGRSPTRASR